MFGLPEKTELNKQHPKKAIYTKFSMNSAQKEKFDADISRIVIVNEISPATVNIAAGKDVSSFYVLLLSLKRTDYNPKTIELITKLIPQKMLLVLEYEGKACLAVWRTKLISTDWQSLDNINVSISGLDLDAVWDNAIMQIGGITVAEGSTLDEQIAVNTEREKLLKEIERLEKKARAENQPKKKFEMVQQIKKLREKINDQTQNAHPEQS